MQLLEVQDGSHDQEVSQDGQHSPTAEHRVEERPGARRVGGFHAGPVHSGEAELRGYRWGPVGAHGAVVCGCL